MERFFMRDTPKIEYKTIIKNTSHDSDKKQTQVNL